MVVGNPTVEGATVTASVIGDGKAKKVIVYKYKRKSGYHKKNGHRQQYTAVKIEKIKRLICYPMIKVTIYKTERHEYVGFDTEDHAGYGEQGQDILCAACSALVINALNSIERFTDDVDKLCI